MKLVALFALIPALAAAQAVTVSVQPNAPVVIASSKARFEVSPEGYIRGYLLKNGAQLGLDEPAGPGDTLRVRGVPAVRFVTDAGKIRNAVLAGSQGRSVTIPAHADGPNGLAIERSLKLEMYDAFPQMVIATVTYKNVGSAPVELEHVTTQHHRLNATQADPKAAPFDMWSFHGSAPKWGQDDVVEITKDFSRPNIFGAIEAEGFGGGVPVVAFWTKGVGTAIGHLDTLPLVCSIPVVIGSDGRPQTGLEIDADTTLKAGETFSVPPTFQMVYAGDYYEPLRMYSLALQRRGWTLPPPTGEDYAATWCGWGYEFNVTSAEMLGIIPKLKDLGIHWATLDDRWFDTYGDWNPRNDTFPGRSIENMVTEYHRNGIKAQIWWLPIGAEVTGADSPSHKHIDSKVVREHPDWLVLDKEGKPAMMTRGLATLCPALKEVQEYHRELTLKFIRDWGFDGHKLDNIYTVPACYNPKHHHKSPNDSINAMGDVYKAIFDTTRQLKPDSVTQACPCGTPPNIGWLRYMDQAVTADPIGGVQVRRRVKLYKALLGPHAAVFGDHVELSDMRRKGNTWEEVGRDFASSIGTGAVVGTKFVWPQGGSKYKAVALTREKNSEWKQWIGIYNEKMLSRGEFRDLYTIGYDTPEGYAIEKDGTMYYAFFTPKPTDRYKGRIELRGLEPGAFRVIDYVNEKNYGMVDAAKASIYAEFSGSLLLQVIQPTVVTKPPKP